MSTVVYEVTVARSKAAMLRFGDAVLHTRAAVQSRRLRSTVEITLLVELPEEDKDAFQRLCRPMFFKPATRVLWPSFPKKVPS